MKNKQGLLNKGKIGPAQYVAAKVKKKKKKLAESGLQGTGQSEFYIIWIGQIEYYGDSLP